MDCSSSIHITIKDDKEPCEGSINQFSYSMFVDKKQPSPTSDDDIPAANKEVAPQKIMEWVDDSKVSKCYNCDTEFSMFTRKHHCRYCGKIFCHVCSSKNIHIPKYLKKINSDEHKINWGIMSMFKAENQIKERVCDKCYNIIIDRNKIYTLINVFSHVDFDLRDYSIISQVSRNWRTIALHYFSLFRQLQYCMPDYEYSKLERKILWDNRHLIGGHSKYTIPLLASIEWNTLSKNDHDYVINLLYNAKRKYTCWSMMCSRLCKPKLTPEEILYALHLNINNFLVRKYLVNLLSETINDTLLICFLPNIVHYIKFSINREDPLLVKFLIERSRRSYRIANFVIWELTIQMLDTQYEKLYSTIRNKIYSTLNPRIKNHIKRGFQFIQNLPEIINKGKVIEHVNGVDTSFDNVVLCIKPELQCIGINYKNIVVKNSHTKPTIAELVCKKISSTKQTKKSITIPSQFKIMYKREDIRIDLIISNIIKIMDNILQREENLHLNISAYNVLPVNDKRGFIEIVPNSETLYDIQKKGFTIQNYIIEHNTDVKINDLRKRFTLSCAAYCVISYLLGIGDRHLENIMITEKGYLFHIDFSYVLGKKAKFMAPEIRITPDMIDAMGGLKSQNYDLFRNTCTRAYNCLRRHYNLFYILLSSLNTIKPKIQGGKYSEKYIKSQILSRFIPGENYDQAKLIFNTKVNRKRSSSYSEAFIDFCHQKAKEPSIMNIFKFWKS